MKQKYSHVNDDLQNLDLLEVPSRDLPHPNNFANFS